MNQKQRITILNEQNKTLFSFSLNANRLTPEKRWIRIRFYTSTIKDVIFQTL